MSIVETIREVLKKVVDSSQGLKFVWWNADLWTCPSNGKNFWGSERTGVTHYSSVNQRFSQQRCIVSLFRLSKRGRNQPVSSRNI